MPSLSESLETFLKVDRSTHTNRNYRRILTTMAAAVGPDRDVRLVSYADMLDYTSKLQPTLAPSSFSAYLLVFKSFFSWAAHNRLIDAAPTANIFARNPPRDPLEVRSIPLEHLAEMRKYAYPNPRNYALLLFLIATAARVGGAATLRLSRLNLDEGEASLLEKGRQYVMVFFDEETAAALRRWIAVRPKADHDYVWTHKHKPDRLEVAGLTDVIQAVSLKSCGVKYGPHRLRHLAAEAMEAAGYTPYDIQYKLNHANSRTTEDHYLTNRHPSVKQITRKMALGSLGSSQLPKPADGKIIVLDDAG